MGLLVWYFWGGTKHNVDESVNTINACQRSCWHEQRRMLLSAGTAHHLCLIHHLCLFKCAHQLPTRRHRAPSIPRERASCRRVSFDCLKLAIFNGSLGGGQMADNTARRAAALHSPFFASICHIHLPHLPTHLFPESLSCP